MDRIEMLVGPHYSRGLSPNATRAQNPGVAGGGDDTGRAALAIAREAVERYVRTGLVAEPPPDVPPDLRTRSGAFVTLRACGRLRGCIGTLLPSRPDIGREIVACAVAAATRDPRFPPVRGPELVELDYEVDLVGPLERVASPADLDPKCYGVLVEAAEQRGVLLPDLEGVEDAEHQVRIARIKAGLPASAVVTLYRFQVRRFRDGHRP
jgi:AmmeMemoRadiSam system protein A